MRQVLGAAIVFFGVAMAGSVLSPAYAGPESGAASKGHARVQPADTSVRRHHRPRSYVYGPAYRPDARWNRPYYYRPYYARRYYQPGYRPYDGYYGPGYGYYGWGARYYAWAPRYYGCCGWGWGGPRFYGPAFGVGFGF